MNQILLGELVGIMKGAPEFDHIWFWKTRLPERKGQKCRVLARGKMNSIKVQFEDGTIVITSRYAVRKTILPAPPNSS